jgi:heat shock protein HtpX
MKRSKDFDEESAAERLYSGGAKEGRLRSGLNGWFDMNTLRTIVLMGFLAALAIAIGGVLGGREGLVLGFVVAMVMNLGSYWFSDKIALAQAGAQPVERSQAPQLYEIVENLSRRAGIPVPHIYITPSEAPNAFATGRDPEHSAVAVTQGILRILNWQELEAVLAHEMAHVRNRDILITSMASVMASVITMIAHWGMWGFGGRDRDRGFNPIFALLLMVLAPLAATLINLAISRSREYQADASGAEICGNPEALASALAKLDEGSRMIPMGVNAAMGNMFTVHPDTGNWFTSLMSTHPPIPERINRLEQMAHRHG